MKAKTKIKTKTSERIIISMSFDEALHITDFIGATSIVTVSDILNKDEASSVPCNDVLTSLYDLIAEQVGR